MIDIAEHDHKYLNNFWFNYTVTTLPFILKAKIKYYIKNYSNNKSRCVKMLNSSLHVDNLCWDTDRVNDVYRLSSDAMNIIKSASMDIHKFNFNSSELKEL